MTTDTSLNAFLNQATRFLFFTGKGGVGKTSLACASAVALADAGKRVLLVSTDPASNLDEVLNTPLSSQPTEIQSVPGLHALNIDPEAAAKAYREKIVGPIRGVLPEATVRNIEEQLSGACTTEIAAFDEFSSLLGKPESVEGFDYVILDTAPTGHTLRLLALPAAWTDFIAENKTGASCLGPLSGLAAQRDTYENALNVLQDSTQTTLVLVARADTPALNEASRASQELANIGVSNQSLILNALFQASDPSDPIAAALQQRGEDALAALPPSLADLPRFETPFRVNGLSGIDRLRQIATTEDTQPHPDQTPYSNSDVDSLADLDELIDELAASGRGVIMTMGKGGVGKTTMAKRIALKLAERGHPTHLTTTDPANHVSDIDLSNTKNLTVSAIDPKKTTEAHVENVLATSGEGLDAEALALLEEEMKSPCIEEIAVFTAFAHEVAKGENQFVVLDTAPTGHTLLLLDATEAYHREVLRNTAALPEAVQRLLPRLRDPDYSKVFVVTLPEATPVHEAAQLQQDLRRAEIEPFAWLVNQSIYATETEDPSLLAKAYNETSYLREVSQEHAKRWAVEPWLADPLSQISTSAPQR